MRDEVTVVIFNGDPVDELLIEDVGGPVVNVEVVFWGSPEVEELANWPLVVTPEDHASYHALLHAPLVMIVSLIQASQNSLQPSHLPFKDGKRGQPCNDLLHR